MKKPQPVPLPVSKTDCRTLVKYLDERALLYDRQPGQRNVCRAWAIRQISEKLKRKLNKSL